MWGYCVLHGYVLSQHILIIIIQRAVASTTTHPLHIAYRTWLDRSAYLLFLSHPCVCVREWETQHIKKYCLAASNRVDTEWKSRLLQECVKVSVCMCTLWPWPLHCLYEHYSSTNTHNFAPTLKRAVQTKMTVVSAFIHPRIIPNQCDLLSAVEYKSYICNEYPGCYF